MHAEQLRLHGGAQGLRDENALESALARAENKAAYGEPTIAELAAAYCLESRRTMPSSTATSERQSLLQRTFLAVNGYALTVDDGALYLFVWVVAAGEIDEAGAAAFFRDHTIPIEA